MSSENTVEVAEITSTKKPKVYSAEALEKAKANTEKFKKTFKKGNSSNSSMLKDSSISDPLIESLTENISALNITGTNIPMYKSVLDAIHKNPLLLCQTIPEMEKKLQRHAGKVVLDEDQTSQAQGTGNKVTHQEASFAAVLENHGFILQAKDKEITVAGKYYYYQLNGSQKSIDFRLVEHDGLKVIATTDFDLKHTVSDVFFLNDGWFHDNVIYIVSWKRKTSEERKKRVVEPAIFIGLGQDIPTKEETALMEELLTIKKKYNTEFKGCGSLCTYIRFANRYTCARFTPEYTNKSYERIYQSSSSSSSSTTSSTL